MKKFKNSRLSTDSRKLQTLALKFLTSLISYKSLQSFIWRHFYCAFLRFCLGTDSNVEPGVGKFGCI